MPNWSIIQQEIVDLMQNPEDVNSNAYDEVRRKYLNIIAWITWRNVIAYYSWWLQKWGVPWYAIGDKDKAWFMLTINWMDRSKWLDIILHTPGWDISATESIVDYLYAMFGNDIRVIVPQICMSAGTMIALSSKEIVMWKQSNLWPIDPQFDGIPCQWIIEEFNRARKDISENPALANLWQPIINKYNPTLLWSCEKAVTWAEWMTLDWLKRNMCVWNETKATQIRDFFSSHEETKNHGRHISKTDCLSKWLNITSLEDNQDLQDCVLSAHHCYMIAFATFPVIKIIENNQGIAYVEQIWK